MTCDEEETKIAKPAAINAQANCRVSIDNETILLHAAGTLETREMKQPLRPQQLDQLKLAERKDDRNIVEARMFVEVEEDINRLKQVKVMGPISMTAFAISMAVLMLLCISPFLFYTGKRARNHMKQRQQTRNWEAAWMKANAERKP